jgi:tetratricopeptide (TPR) repeat protein
LLRPTVGYTVSFGTVQAYLEAYGPATESVAVKYEVTAGENAPALVETEASGVPGGRERTIFSEMLQVGRLPPGKYVLRASVSSARKVVKILARPFEIAAPAVLMTSADSTGPIAPPPAEVYLPVASTQFNRPFRREDASAGEVLRIFRESVTPESRAAFDKGVAFLASGDYMDAEESFKSALRTDDQSSVALAYLGATFAASGHDTEAAGAWHTSLIDGSEFPQIYEWLADTLMRLHQIAEARTVLEEAASKWPADLRFAKPLALVYATFGQGREATRMLERHLSGHPGDADGLALGVEWMYQLHSSGAAVRSAAEDLKLASAWAEAYERTKGPQTALVKEWLQALKGASGGP